MKQHDFDLIFWCMIYNDQWAMTIYIYIVISSISGVVIIHVSVWGSGDSGVSVF